jgi:rhamnosyltransferase
MENIEKKYSIKHSGNKTALVIVLYNPSDEDKECLYELSVHYHGVVVDNSTKRNFDDNRIGMMTYVFDGKNKGIAKAQNVALRLLTHEEYIVFLDQDTRIHLDYPEQIVSKYIQIQNQFTNLSILGPTLINKQTEEKYASKIHKDNYLSSSFIRKPNIISSGSCVSKKVLDDVGLNDERLFIDFVDSEWCWRANSKGYICGVTTDVEITHSIGRKIIKIWLFMDIVSSPARYFYQYRNYLWLLRRKYVPLQWKINVGIKDIIRLFYIPVCLKDGLTMLKYILKGIASGAKMPRS